ncbi:MAG TPA: hypothetical protein VN893_26230 [Bryobacteraceae bacterium]|nr:hypothetical protein [Bryobacteraceae bacterium]
MSDREAGVLSRSPLAALVLAGLAPLVWLGPRGRGGFRSLLDSHS